MAELDSKEYCSCLANVMGIKFYTGMSKLHSTMNVLVATLLPECVEIVVTLQHLSNTEDWIQLKTAVLIINNK